MASNYPTSLDNFTNPTSNDSLNSPSHSLQHANINDAVEAIEAKLGIGASPAGSATSGYVLTAGTGGTTTWAEPSIAGLTQIVPTSIVKGASGTASVTAGGTITFTNTESISVNGVFTSNYDNYLLVVYYVPNAQAEIRINFRTSGTDNTSNSYKTQRLRSYGTTLNSNSATSTYAEVASFNGTVNKSLATTIVSTPQQSERTSFITHSGTYDYEHKISGIFDNTTSFDGFTYSMSSGTSTGKVSIYAYARN